ncbi:MAG: hypothetical protein AAGF92_14635 [Myxococcota bacterium]
MIARSQRCHAERWDGVWRVVEESGKPCFTWLPWEAGDGRPLDRGGFHPGNSDCPKPDAELFALAVTGERAAYGLIPGLRREDVERERARYDRYRTVTPLPTPETALTKASSAA